MAGAEGLGNAQSRGSGDLGIPSRKVTVAVSLRLRYVKWLVLIFTSKEVVRLALRSSNGSSSNTM